MTSSFNPGHFKFLLDGAFWTLVLSLMAFVGGGLIGFAVALARISPLKTVRYLATGYVQLVQGTPLLVIMFVTYFGLPQLGISVAPREDLVPGTDAKSI